MFAISLSSCSRYNANFKLNQSVFARGINILTMLNFGNLAPTAGILTVKVTAPIAPFTTCEGHS